MTPFNRRLLYAILLYTCVEGLVVNLTFPSKFGYVVKDVALVLSVAVLMAGNEGERFGSLRRLTLPLGLFALVQTFYLLLPSDLPWMARLIGLKMRLLYISAMLLGYRFVREPGDCYRLLLVLVLSSIPVSLFGLYLFVGGPGTLQALGGSYSAVIISTTGFWRVPGTFNSPGQYGLYLAFNAIVAAALLLTPGVSKRMTVLLWVSLGFMILAMLASGSRAPLILALACVGGVVLAMGRASRVVSIGIGLYILFAVGFSTLGAGVEDRVGSIASMEHVERFNRTYFGQLFIPKLLETPMGLGLGAATIGARHFSEFGQVLLVESYFGLVAIETGLIGLLTLLIVCAAIVAFAVKGRALMSRSDVAPAWLSLAAFVLMVVLLSPVSTPLDTTPGNLYFWLSLGIVVRLYDLERWKQAAQLTAAPDAAYGWPPPLDPHPMPAPQA